MGWGWAKMCLGVDVGRVCPQRRPCLNTSMDIPQRAGPAVAGRKREVGLVSFSLVRVVFALSFPASPPLHPQSQHFLAHPNLCLLSPPEVTAGLGASSRSWGISGGKNFGPVFAELLFPSRNLSPGSLASSVYGNSGTSLTYCRVEPTLNCSVYISKRFPERQRTKSAFFPPWLRLLAGAGAAASCHLCPCADSPS